jgi:hypothetical protein
MKFRATILIITIFSFSTCFSQVKSDSINSTKHHNKIDDLENPKEIQALLKSIDKRYSNFKIIDLSLSTDKICKFYYDSLKLKTFTKADFDNNGYTDILVIGEFNYPSIVCIFDKGENNFSINRLTRQSFQDCSFPVVNMDGMQAFIDYYYFKQSEDWRQNDTSRILQTKKLIYKFGDFIEYNDLPKNYNIQKIEYETTMCFGTCPVFNLTIYSDHSAKYEALKFNKPNGKFDGTIDGKTYSELVALLNYINFPNLKENYSVGWTDDQTCTLKITYDNGKTKTITDYGKIGTYGLNRVYSILFSLRQNQKWK